jgi:hypothetical protein
MQQTKTVNKLIMFIDKENWSGAIKKRRKGVIAVNG